MIRTSLHRFYSGRCVMLRTIQRRGLVLLFLPPYIYLALLLDFTYHSVIGFISLLFLTIAAGFLMKRTNQLILLLIGNCLSALFSYLLCISHPDWHFFYQPFSPSLLVVLLSLIYLVPQFIGIFWASLLPKPTTVTLLHHSNKK